jgi:acyl-CoA synthetase (AMP-forming)/AMP-acid ligase II
MTEPSLNLWRERLYARLVQQPYPLWIDETGILPAASLWAMLRERVEVLRSHNIAAGDRIVLAASSERKSIAWMLAALWEDCTVALTSPIKHNDIGETVRMFDPKASIASDSDELTLHTSFHAATSDISFILSTSGSTGNVKRIALSAANVFSVIDSHVPLLDLYDRDAEGDSYRAARVLSILPLHHAFGLVIDFFTAFFAGAEIVRSTQGARNLDALLQLAHEHSITHCSMVPLIAQRLAARADGRAFLQGLQGGVIGGAPVDTLLAEFLATTRLRVGYGQTEASPGIALGKAAVWTAGYLGEAVGCETRLARQPDVGTVLEFRGANACVGTWTENGLERHDPGTGTWRNTGDCIETSTDAAYEGYIFRGRADDSFKLSNGRFVPVAVWEYALQQSLRIEFSFVQDVMLFTWTGEMCDVCLRSKPDFATSETDIETLRTAVMRTLPLPAKYVGQLYICPTSEWKCTSKGNTDRRAMLRMMRSSLTEQSFSEQSFSEQ